MIVDNVLVNFT